MYNAPRFVGGEAEGEAKATPRARRRSRVWWTLADQPLMAVGGWWMALEGCSCLFVACAGGAWRLPVPGWCRALPLDLNCLTLVRGSLH